MLASRSPQELTQRGRFAFLLKDAALYGGAAAVNKAFSLVTFPILARHFSVAEYGVLDYFVVLSGLLAIFFVFGQDSAVARFFYESDELADRRQLISQSFFFQIAVILAFLPILWWAAAWITPWLIAGTGHDQLFRIVSLQLPCLVMINFSQNLLKWNFERVKFLSMTLGATIVQMSILVLSVRMGGLDIAGVLWISLATHAVFAVVGLFFVRHWLTWPSGWSHLRRMLPYAIPMGIVCCIGALSPTLERSLTDTLLGAESLGLYAAAAKIAMLIGLLVSSFQTAWGPFSLALHRQPDAGETYNRVFKWFALGACVVALLITGLSDPLLRILAGERYLGASVVVFPVVMSLAVQATSWITEIGIGISKRSYLSLYAYTASLGTTLIGITVFTAVFGLMGVGVGVLLGLIVKAMLASWLAQIAYPLPWDYRHVIVLLGLTMVAGFGGTLVKIQYGEGAAILTLAIGIGVVIAASVCNVFTQKSGP